MAVMKYLGSDGLYHVLPAYVSSQVQSVNGKTGIVELSYNDIHNLPEELDKKITAPTTGEAGQLLSRKADGTVEWKTVSTEAPSYIAKSFDKTQTYGVGDYVFYDNDLYKAKGFVPAGEFNPTQWDAVKVMDEIGAEAVNNLCSEWTTTGVYTAGSMVMHEGKLYICKETAATVGTFNPAQWQQTKAVDELYRLVRKLIDFLGFKFDPNWDGTKVDYLFKVL